MGNRPRRPVSPSLAVRATAGASIAVLVASVAAAGLRAATPTGEPSTTTTVAAAPERAGTPPSSAPAPQAVARPPASDVSTPAAAPPALQNAATPDTPDGDVALVIPDGTQAAATSGVTAAAVEPPITAPTTPVGAANGGTPRARFDSQFPAQAAATQDPARPTSSRWAVLVGINNYQAPTHDAVGSRQDAESTYSQLMSLGWQPDHVLLLTDGLATREAMTEAIRWLGRKTDQNSVAVFWYSGHAKQWPGQDVDGDGEATDEGLWPSDNDHITDREFADLMAGVRAGRLWINVMACEAAGFLDPGLVQDGRVVTYSSAESEKSYEDPSVGHSVWGWNLVVQGMRLGLADANGDGDVTVQEAMSYTVPRAVARTNGQQPYGPQHGGMVDRSGGAFSLQIPAPPAPAQSAAPAAPPRQQRQCLLFLCGPAKR